MKADRNGLDIATRPERIACEKDGIRLGTPRSYCYCSATLDSTQLADAFKLGSEGKREVRECWLGRRLGLLKECLCKLVEWVPFTNGSKKRLLPPRAFGIGSQYNYSGVRREALYCYSMMATSHTSKVYDQIQMICYEVEQTLSLRRRDFFQNLSKQRVQNTILRRAYET